MSWKKSLSIVAMSLFSFGCSKNIYNFDGMIENVRVESGVTLADKANFMKIKDPDGTRTICFDYSWDLRLDEVEVSKNGTTETFYSSSLLQDPKVVSAQTRFDSYRREIARRNFAIHNKTKE